MKARLSVFLTALLILMLLQPVGLGQASAAGLGQAAAAIPTFSIVSVVPGVSVTIQTTDFPANQTFTVRMGQFGTRGINGTVVGTTSSGSGGSFKVSYNIPDGLKTAAQVAIRMDSPQGYFAYNWFNNVSGTTIPDTGPVYTGIPTFAIETVVRDASVTVLTNNFPANQTFTVRMGAIGTRAINGTVVGTTSSGSGGAFRATYTIPAGLKGAAQIAIRMDSPQGYYAYNWFYNSGSGTVVTPVPTPVPGTPVPPPYVGYPSFSIGSVVRDSTVTLNTANFPPNQTFTVRMGAMGTLGINGYVVTTVNSGAGGAFTATYNIPAEMRGASQIAIRLESSQGYFAFNWFYNYTYP